MRIKQPNSTSSRANPRRKSTPITAIIHIHTHTHQTKDPAKKKRSRSPTPQQCLVCCSHRYKECGLPEPRRPWCCAQQPGAAARARGPKNEGLCVQALGEARLGWDMSHDEGCLSATQLTCGCCSHIKYAARPALFPSLPHPCRLNRARRHHSRRTSLSFQGRQRQKRKPLDISTRFSLLHSSSSTTQRNPISHHYHHHHPTEPQPTTLSCYCYSRRSHQLSLSPCSLSRRFGCKYHLKKRQ